jgi:hypothetical protein
LPGSRLATVLCQLHSITERVLREDASVSVQLNRVGNDAIAAGLEVPRERVQVVNGKRRMGLLGRAEVILHAKVQLLSTALKPDATAGREWFRLRNLN